MFERITFEPKIMGGRACIRGMRITLGHILRRVRNGGLAAVKSVEEALATADDLDLDVVAEVVVERVDGGLWLALRGLDMVRRLGVGPSADAELERLQGTVEAIVGLLPGTAAGGSPAASGEAAGRC